MREAAEGAAAAEGEAPCWVCGEAASVEVEIRNPTVIPIKVRGALGVFAVMTRAHDTLLPSAPALTMLGVPTSQNHRVRAAWACLRLADAGAGARRCDHRARARGRTRCASFLLSLARRWLQVERLTLEVEWAGHPSVAPRDQAAAAQQPVWKPSPVAMWLPPETPATRVVLTGTPLAAGMFTVVGCQVAALGVSWRQPWAPRGHFAADHSWQPGNHSLAARDHSGLAQVRAAA